MLTSLTRIRVKSSVVVESPLEDCWSTCRAWGRQPWMPLLPDGTSFDVHVLEGFAETEVGAVRSSKFGSGAQLFERLVAVDDDKHFLKWQLVNSPHAVSPFEEASFVNFSTTLTLLPVTIGNYTYAEWTGEFFTEPQFAESMRDTFETWYTGGMMSLKEYMARQRAKNVPIGHSQAKWELPKHGPNSRQSEAIGNSSAFIAKPL